MSTNQHMNDILPQRLTEKSFRRFEADLLKAVQVYPAIIELDVAKYGLSPVTLTARFRDGMSSLNTYKWTTAVGDSFFSLYEDIGVFHRGSKVFVGSKKEFAKGYVSQPETATIVPMNVDPIDASIPAENPGEILCKLVASSYLKGPLKVKLKPESVDSLEFLFDVRIDKNPDGTYTIL